MIDRACYVHSVEMTNNKLKSDMSETRAKKALENAVIDHEISHFQSKRESLIKQTLSSFCLWEKLTLFGYSSGSHEKFPVTEEGRVLLESQPEWDLYMEIVIPKAGKTLSRAWWAPSRSAVDAVGNHRDWKVRFVSLWNLLYTVAGLRKTRSSFLFHHHRHLLWLVLCCDYRGPVPLIARREHCESHSLFWVWPACSETRSLFDFHLVLSREPSLAFVFLLGIDFGWILVLNDWAGRLRMLFSVFYHQVFGQISF